MSKASDPYFPRSLVIPAGHYATVEDHPGITIREAFIMAAMQGLAVGGHSTTGRSAVEIAESTMRAAGIEP